jgi:crossover junction endodeoxyribonuclease RusA
MADAGYIEPFFEPVLIALTFKLHRPLSHYGSGKNARLVKPSAPKHPAKVPDIDKLTRAVLDALTSIVWVDDSQVVRLTASKVYVDRWQEEGVHLDVSTYEG